MPAATEQPAAKKERDELLWQALKEHIMKERQKKKEEQEAEVEEERLRKEREERDRQDAMTLGETRDQIQLLNTRLEELKNEKQQLFLRLKKVLNEDEIRKKQKEQKDSEMFALQNMVPQQGPHSQIFLPPRAPHQQMMQKYLQSVPPIGNIPPPNKRGRSPSPTLSGYYKANSSPYSQSAKHEDGRREVARTVLWNKPTYQNPPGTLYYPAPANSQEQRGGQAIIYPFPSGIHQGYHVELQQTAQPPPPSQSQSSKDPKSVPPGAQVYHINLDQSSASAQQSQPPPGAKLNQSQQSTSVQHKQHGPQIGMEKKLDHGYQQSGHLPENMYRITPLHANAMMGIQSQIPGQQNQVQNSNNNRWQQKKATSFILQMQPGKPGGNISQGYGQQQPPPNQQYPRRY